MYKKKPKVFITRRLPKQIETRMMELFDTTLNEKDVLLTENELINVFKNPEKYNSNITSLSRTQELEKRVTTLEEEVKKILYVIGK